jgi:hypothetical protein
MYEPMTDEFLIEFRKQRKNLDKFKILEKRQNDLFETF